MFHKNKLKSNKSRSSFQIIIFSFLIIILTGSLLLMLPIAAKDRIVTPFSDTLFTAVSATCVTGLIVHDTATYWSMFGQAVILMMIQVGGMGVITVSLAVMRAAGKKIGLWQRSTMQESISAPHVGGIVRLTGFILKATAAAELVGAVLLAPVFCSDFGILKGIWYSIFHSISAFCNAGFDLMGIRERYSSLCTYGSNVLINIVIMLLITVGGIGFITIRDIKTHKHRLGRYSLQSKVVLLTSLILVVLPAVYFFLFEYGDMSMGDRVLSSLFQSVTTRTAGFNTQDLSQMSESGKAVMMVLMLIGGSPGSTAGGLKTATFAVLFLSAITVFSRRNDVECFKRRIADTAVRNAGAILFMYLSLFFVGGVIISTVEGLPLIDCLFETGSAIGTVGLTLGITTSLSLASRIILMVLMFFGRVGGLTLIYAAFSSSGSNNSRLPLENITVG